MAESLEEHSSKFDDLAKQMTSFSGMAKQFEGLRQMMQQTLDSVNSMGSRQTSAEVMLDDLRTSTDAATTTLRNTSSRIDSLVTRMDSLEAPTNPGITLGPGVLGGPPLTTAAPPPPWSLNLNLALGSSSCSPMMDEEQPKGHGDHCGGIMASRPQSSSESTFIETPPENLFQSDSVPRSPPFPKIEFPKFDGSNPRLWQDHCTMFFEVYAVHPSLKTRFAALNFIGIAKTWLHTVERRERISDWTTLCNLAAHNLLLYNPNYDEMYFVTCFLAGLKEDIRSGIVLHWPPDVDTANALALLQETELGRSKGRVHGKNEFRGSFKTNVEKMKFGDGDKPKQQPVLTETEDKLTALKNFRRKNGLCFKCGNKWSKDHKCPPQVALHVIEELLDALEDEGLDSEELDSEILEESVMSVGHSVPSDQVKRTMKLCGKIGKHDEPNTLPPQRPFDHHIKLLLGDPPVNIRPYRYSPAQKDEIEKQLSEMLKNGIIKHSQSPYASPVLLVKKKNGSWRFCVDYRHLNAQTVKNKHPMPIVDELIDELAGAKWFSKLDFRAGYHQICIHPEDTHKTAFKTHSGLYEFLVMAFGLTNAPATFQSVMNLIFADLLRKGVIVFMDDILVYSATREQHVNLLKQKEVEYLGHCVSSQGVATEKSKIAAVEQWPIPKNVKELRGFLAQSAFNQLKHSFVHAPVLAIPDFSKTFTLETDASDVGFGALPHLEILLYRMDLSDIKATYYRVRNIFSWPGMKAAIAQFVQECQICQQAKIVRMDFIEGLPKSQKFNTIMVVIDKYTKYGHFIPLAHPFSALVVAQAYLDSVYKLHRLPQGIVSD
ncbi:uncharacterized protein [Miscanthus floridulus]|uniref:uncharacterized protein n=1 Tax=Miscanthus floridulus TaxID=154761 RepID=UPI00345B1E6A